MATPLLITLAGVDESSQLTDGFYGCAIFNGKSYPIAIGNAAVSFFENPELINQHMADRKRVKNLKPDFSDPLMNAKMNGMGSTQQMQTPRNSKVDNYRGISSKSVKSSKKKKTRTVSVSVETEISSSDSEKSPRPTVFSILQQKVASSSVDPAKRKRKMAELLEQRLETSDSEEEQAEEHNKRRRKSFSTVVTHGRGGKGRGRGKRGEK